MDLTLALCHQEKQKNEVHFVPSLSTLQCELTFRILIIVVILGWTNSSTVEWKVVCKKLVSSFENSLLLLVSIRMPLLP